MAYYSHSGLGIAPVVVGSIISGATSLVASLVSVFGGSKKRQKELDAQNELIEKEYRYQVQKAQLEQDAATRKQLEAEAEAARQAKITEALNLKKQMQQADNNKAIVIATVATLGTAMVLFATGDKKKKKRKK